MEYLYACHFSNGHIKVGRSISALARGESEPRYELGAALLALAYGATEAA